jgi:DNA-3-methyladenine glycosylase
MAGSRLKRHFFERDTLIVAKELLGKTLVRVTEEGAVRARIVETEAYLGEIDDAAHTYKGKSERTRAAYGEKGAAYIYLIYGMYCCFNITTGEPNKPEMVLIRALEPLEGETLMKARRLKAKKDIDLCNGPGKL